MLLALKIKDFFFSILQLCKAPTLRWVHPNVLMNAFMNKQMLTKCDSDICMHLHVPLTGKHADVSTCAKSTTLNESPAFPVGCLIVTITHLTCVFASMQE